MIQIKCQVSGMIGVLIFAFGISFYTLNPKQVGPDLHLRFHFMRKYLVFKFFNGICLIFCKCIFQPSFYSIPLSWIKVLDMMVGEIEYSQVWINQIQNNNIKFPKSITALIMIVVFIVLMPIVVMNLMVSLQQLKLKYI